MKVLFCGAGNPSKVLGGPKVTAELVESMRVQGWTCDIAGRDEIVSLGAPNSTYAEALRDYLKIKAREYDIIDYDHLFLPYPRELFPANTLMVARSVLLVQHFEKIEIPYGKFLKSQIRRFFLGWRDREEWQRKVAQAQATVLQADLVNVSNDDDRDELISRGVKRECIIVLTYGISDHRRRLFDQISSALPENPVIAFVGTFDYRKGAREFPKIIETVLAQMPEASFRLLGTAGMFPTKESVLRHFPSSVHAKIDVVPRYDPDDLPNLLSTCTAGIFPSYVEGFPFGILEMLAASVPVIAYDSPGAPMTLRKEYLVNRGDAVGLAKKVIDLLTDKSKLAEARVWAKKRSQEHRWTDIAAKTISIYQERWDLLQERAGKREISQII